MITFNNNNTSLSCRKPVQFTAGNGGCKLSQATIDRFGLNMKTWTGYKGKPDYMPAPESVKSPLREFFHKLEINWNTHIDPTKKKRRFE